jgi:serine/threonine protein kinase
VILGRYRIVSKIGEGAMGAVYRAEQKMGTTVRSVAVKVLLDSHILDPALRVRFMRECEVVVRLEHPNTIKFYDFGELPDGSLAIVMEYVDGESLAAVIARGPLPVERALRIIGQICGSLHEAHSRGIVHRDLKPENVLLGHRAGEPDVVKVLDFGIAKLHDPSQPSAGALTLQGTVLGTPVYMSPEQFVGLELDARSDVYSLGILTYEMLTGTLPYPRATTTVEWADRHLNATPTPIEAHAIAHDLSPRAREVLMQSLEKLPERRSASVLEFARGLIGQTELESAWGLGTNARAKSAAPPVVAVSAPLTSAPALEAPPFVESPADAELVVPRTRSLSALLAIGCALAAVGGYFAFVHRTDNAAGVSVPAPSTSTPEPTPEEAPSEWMRIVHHARGVVDPSAAIGAPDRRFARIEGNGMLTLEMVPGTVVATDRGPGPDLYIAVNPATSGPYRVEAAADHDHFLAVVSDVEGTLPLDLDQFKLGIVRYVRLTNRSGSPVDVDAIGLYRTEAEPEH